MQYAPVADELGQILQQYHYDAYGNAVGFDPAEALTNLLYSGEQFNPVSGLQYLRARWYNPQSGTFNRLDPFAGNQQSPLSFHKYAYGHMNPVLNADPTGQYASLLIGAIVGALVLGGIGYYASGGSLLMTGIMAMAGVGIGIAAVLYAPLIMASSFGLALKSIATTLATKGTEIVAVAISRTAQVELFMRSSGTSLTSVANGMLLEDPVQVSDDIGAALGFGAAKLWEYGVLPILDSARRSLNNWYQKSLQQQQDIFEKKEENKRLNKAAYQKAIDDGDLIMMDPRTGFAIDPEYFM